MGYPQAATIIACDNTTAVGLANSALRLRKSKFMDMRFNWINDRVRQGIFDVQWHPGTDIIADFFTKALPIHAHQFYAPFLTRFSV